MEKTTEQLIADHLHHIGKRLDVMQTTLAYMGLGQRAEVRFVHRDIDVVMHLPDALTDNIQKFIMEKRCFWEEALLVKVRSHLEGCHRVLDIGANIGNHTLFFRMVAGVPHVIALEPQAHVHAILLQNIARNGLQGVEAIQAAVGAAPGQAEIGLHRHRSFHGTTFKATDGGAVALTTVDQIAADAPVDFIKIDVEGMQLDVLHGAEQVLRRDRPKLWVELRRNHGEFDPANDWLTGLGLGYRAVALGGDDILFLPG